jgi:ribose-phosphate pyrophosphokinase
LGIRVVSNNDCYFTQQLAAQVGSPLLLFNINSFADGESYFSASFDTSLLKDQSVLIVYQWETGASGLSDGINKQVLNLLFFTDLMHQMGARKIMLFIPYMPYARQEKSYCGNYPGAFSTLCFLFKQAHIDMILTCDLHSQKNLDGPLCPIYSIEMGAFWVNIINKICLDYNITKENLCIASPDEGGRVRAQGIAQLLDVPAVWIKKKRVALDYAVAVELVGDVQKKHVVIIDDIIDTAHTATRASLLLRQQGALKVFGCFTHAVFSHGACERVCDGSFDLLWVSDTLPICDGIAKTVNIAKSSDFLVSRLKEILFPTAVRQYTHKSIESAQK